MDVIEILKRVKEPSTETNIIELGIVERIEVGEEGYTIYVNFSKFMPSCKSCVPIAWLIARAILREMKRVLDEEEIKYKIVEL